ncbi:uncharacterized protein METZ01_LOCUS186888 [marine metagenome]|uniref:Uncharacterized protein n=1 Tax=marine metagenome TaxID=408172 RepID=A0A382D7K3_9ZZZZ
MNDKMITSELILVFPLQNSSGKL